MLEIIAHRGYSKIAPENTLFAFQKAIEWGVHSLEFDLQISADGVPVIFHDQTLNRLTQTEGTIREKSLAQLQQLSIKTEQNITDETQTLPTLEEALPLLKRVPHFLYFDIKNHAQWRDSEIQSFVLFLQRSGLQKKSILTSFNEDFLTRCLFSDSKLKIGYFLTHAADYQQQFHKAKAINKGCLSCHYSVIFDYPPIVQDSLQHNIDLVVWTVDEVHIAQQLYDLGVNRFISNDLSLFSQINLDS